MLDAAAASSSSSTVRLPARDDHLLLQEVEHHMPRTRTPTPTPSLPPYSPSQLTPAYTYAPCEGEERLAISARTGYPSSLGEPSTRTRSTTRTSVFSCSTRRRARGDPRRGVTLTIAHQEPDVRLPTFGKNARISGWVDLNGKAADVDSVDIQLQGHLKLTIAEGGKKTRQLFSITHTIWSRSDSRPTCPDSLPFDIQMPSTYTEHDRLRPLPPTYQIIFPGVPGLFVHTVYGITVKVTRERRLLWRNADMLHTDMKYYPRTRAPRPILKPTLPFFSMLKHAPDEFCQVQSSMKSRARSGFDRIHCLLFLPSTCIYALTEEIPFHLQLIAPLSALLHLMCCADPSHHDHQSHRDAMELLRECHRDSASGGSEMEDESRQQDRRPSGEGEGAFSQHQDQNLHPHPRPPPPLVPSYSSSPPSPTSPTGTSLLHALSTRLAQGASSMLALPRTHSHFGVEGVRQRKQKPCVRVFLLRQITVEVRGQKAWRTCVLGEGVLKPTNSSSTVRRTHSRSSSSSSSDPHGHDVNSDDAGMGFENDEEAHDDPIEALDWDGTLRVASPAEVQVGGFVAWPAPPPPAPVSTSSSRHGERRHGRSAQATPTSSTSSSGTSVSASSSSSSGGGGRASSGGRRSTGEERAARRAARPREGSGTSSSPSAASSSSSSGGLIVKDFVVLSIVPPDPARSALMEHQCAHPVRLVTDPGRVVVREAEVDVEAEVGEV